ncbi:MAG: zinc ribbon domain-containing protein [Desulfobacteraceae bacterium]|nr:MAG: zinc ribbon domain-containing protein [Desulfobacteraceae bacterium]
MPIYEYRCSNCKTVFQQIILKMDEERKLNCPKCGRPGPSRLISRVAFHVSERARLDAYDPSAPKGDSFYRDSRNIGLDAKKRARQMGVDLGRGFEEKLERLRTDPGSVLKDGD